MFERLSQLLNEVDHARDSKSTIDYEIQKLALIVLTNDTGVGLNWLALAHEHELEQTAERLLGLLQEDRILIELHYLAMLCQKSIFDIQIESLLVYE